MRRKATPSAPKTESAPEVPVYRWRPVRSPARTIGARSARRLPAAPGDLEVRASGGQRRVELGEELGAPLGLVPLADAAGGPTQPLQAAQEAPVGLVGPPHVAAPSPAAGPQPVEAGVVGARVAGVGLDVVRGGIAQPRPAVEEPGPPGAYGGDGVPPFGLGAAQRLVQRRQGVGRLEV